MSIAPVLPAKAVQPGVDCGHWRRICTEELPWDLEQRQMAEELSSELWQQPL